MGVFDYLGGAELYCMVCMGRKSCKKHSLSCMHTNGDLASFGAADLGMAAGIQLQGIMLSLILAVF